jgi:hypothetical protein
MEHELRQYPRIDLDVDALAAHVGKLVLAAGRESRDYPTYQTSRALADKLGMSVLELPGGHIGCVTQPVQFATELTCTTACMAAVQRHISSRSSGTLDCIEHFQDH